MQYEAIQCLDSKIYEDLLVEAEQNEKKEEEVVKEAEKGKVVEVPKGFTKITDYFTKQ